MGGPFLISERVGAQWIWGIAPSWQVAAERLAPYPLETVLEVVGRISALLRSPSEATLDLQVRICAGLLGETEAAWIHRRLVTWLGTRRREHPDGPVPSVTLFHHLVLPAAVKVACAACTRDRRGAADDGLAAAAPRDFAGIGVAILILNDLLDEHTDSPVDYDLDSVEDRLHWVQYAFVGSAVPGTGVTTHVLARAVELFLSAHPALMNDRDYVDLPAMFTAATGLTVEGYLRVLLAMLSPLFAITPASVAGRGASLPLARLRAAGLGEDLDRVLAFVGADVATFRARVGARYPGPRIESHDSLALEQMPVVRFGSHASGSMAALACHSEENVGVEEPEVLVCHSVGMLQERLTSGLYHTLLNAHAVDDEVGRGRYMRFVGRVFEGYVDRVFRRMYGDVVTAPPGNGHTTAGGRRATGAGLARGIAESPTHGGTSLERRPSGAPTVHPRYFDEAELRAALRQRSRRADHQSLCDGLVVVGDTVLVIEAKARFFAGAARAGEAPGAFRARLEEILVRGARQLHRTVEWLLDGAFTSFGVEPANVSHVLPLIVSLQELPTNLLLRWWLDERLAAEGYLCASETRATIHPLEVLSVADLEWAESGHARGVCLADVLRRKHQDRWGQNHSLSTYAVVRGLAGAAWRDRNPYLERRYNELTHAPRASLRRMLRASRR